MRRAQDRVIGARPYAKALRAVLASVSARVAQSEHPLLAAREERRIVLLVVAGDKGLAGAFNANIQRAVASLLAEKTHWESVAILPIGKKAVDYWKRRQRPLAPRSYAGLFARVEYAQAKEIADYLADPQKLSPGSEMPDQRDLSPGQRQMIGEFIAALAARERR